MFALLRRHQKVLFIVVGALVVLSFSFFGTFDILMRQGDADRVLCKSLGKRPIRERDVVALTHFLTHSPYAWGNELSLLHDGVIERDFLASGLGAALADTYLPALQQEIAERASKLRHFQPYEHPSDPHISLKALWKRIAPALHARLQEVQGKEAGFGHLADLYLHALQCPAEHVRQLLLTQQEKRKADPDPALRQVPLSPAGFSSYADWFGPTWLSLVSQCILNVADVAEKEGVRISQAEAKRELFRLFSENLAHVKKEPEREKRVQEFRTACAELGLHEQHVVDLWRKVLLFRTFLADAAEAIVLDALPFAQSSALAHETMTVDLYAPPEPLPFRDLFGLARWQLYTEALPKQSSLSAKTYDISYASVHRSSVSCAFSLKEMWQWASQDHHWEKLAATFAELSATAPKTPEERFCVLAAYEPGARIAIDKAIQRAMLEKSGNIERALEAAEKKEATVLFGEHIFHHPFSGMTDPQELLALLEQKEPVKCITFDGDVYYRIESTPSARRSRLLHFHEAKPLLDSWLEEALEAVYPEARKNQPKEFRAANGTPKPLKEVKEQLVRFAFAPVLKEIEAAYLRSHDALPGESLKLPSHFYVRHYHLATLQAAREALMEGRDVPLALKHERCEITRSQGGLFNEDATPWSDVTYDPERGLVFFKVLSSEPGAAEPHKGVWEARKALQSEAKRQVAKKLLAEMTKHGAIAAT